MEMIKIPHTDLEVSRLAMGCMGLGGGWGSGTQLTTDHERQARELVKFQQRYQMRNRILSKAVPAWEFCSFCDSQKCLPLVRQFWGLIPTVSCSFSSEKSYSPPF